MGSGDLSWIVDLSWVGLQLGGFGRVGSRRCRNSYFRRVFQGLTSAEAKKGLDE